MPQIITRVSIPAQHMLTFLRSRAQEYNGKKLKNVATGDLDLPEDEAEKARLEELRASYAGLCSLMKEVLGDKVEKVLFLPCNNRSRLVSTANFNSDHVL